MTDPLAPLTPEELAHAEVIQEPAIDPMAVVPVKLPSPLHDLLKNDADRQGIGVSTLARQIINQHYTKQTGTGEVVPVRINQLRTEVEQAIARATGPLPPAAAA